MKLRKAISQRIRALREASGLSQQEVAERSELSLSLVAKLEQGKKADPRVSSLLALARALDVQPGELINNLPLKSSKDAAENGVEEEKGKKKKDKKRAKHEASV